MNAIDVEVRKRAAWALLAAAFEQAAWMFGPVDRDQANRMNDHAESFLRASRDGLAAEDTPEVGP